MSVHRVFVLGVAFVSVLASMAARGHAPRCEVVPVANVDVALLRAVVGDGASGPPLVANECMHGSAHMWTVSGTSKFRPAYRHRASESSLGRSSRLSQPRG